MKVRSNDDMWSLFYSPLHFINKDTIIGNALPAIADHSWQVKPCYVHVNPVRSVRVGWRHAFTTTRILFVIQAHGYICTLNCHGHYNTDNIHKYLQHTCLTLHHSTHILVLLRLYGTHWHIYMYNKFDNTNRQFVVIKWHKVNQCTFIIIYIHTITM
jgi:hypothetical protein